MIMFSPMAGRTRKSVASELERTLLISKSSFPYFMLIAFEAGGPFRALMLLLVSPILSLLEIFGFEAMALQVMIFVSMAGLRIARVKAVARATLPRFYLQDLSEKAFHVFSSCGGKKYVMTSMPRIMVQPFLREYLDVDCVIGTKLAVIGGFCLGLEAAPGVMAGSLRFEFLQVALEKEMKKVDLGLGEGFREHPLCQEIYVPLQEEKPIPLPRRNYPKPLVFQDGRLAVRPTPVTTLVIFLWLPMGLFLAFVRILAGIVLPYKLCLPTVAAAGFRIRAKFPSTPGKDVKTKEETGTLYLCSHRTLLDPVILATTLQHSVTAVTYSVSRFSELISPIPTARLTRDRSRDGETMRALLRSGDLVVCPEGTTCREPYLLRFSPLFAEVTDDVVPVAVVAGGSMFYGTSTSGSKWLDSIYFFMNPDPYYCLEFLEKVSCNINNGSSHDIANHAQRVIGDALGFECTRLTRRDKYRLLAGNDGVNYGRF